MQRGGVLGATEMRRNVRALWWEVCATSLLKPRPTRACRRRETALYLYWVTWENPRHPVPGRDRPIEPWSVETGAERGSSRPGLLKPVQLFGAVEPVSARAGRQEFV